MLEQTSSLGLDRDLTPRYDDPGSWELYEAIQNIQNDSGHTTRGVYRMCTCVHVYDEHSLTQSGLYQDLVRADLATKIMSKWSVSLRQHPGFFDQFRLNMEMVREDKTRATFRRRGIRTLIKLNDLNTLERILRKSWRNPVGYNLIYQVGYSPSDGPLGAEAIVVKKDKTLHYIQERDASTLAWPLYLGTK